MDIEVGEVITTVNAASYNKISTASKLIVA